MEPLPTRRKYESAIYISYDIVEAESRHDEVAFECGAFCLGSETAFTYRECWSVLSCHKTRG